MKARTLTRILGVILPAALVIISPVFAHDPYYSGGHVDHDYSYGGHVDHEYGNGRHVDHDYSYGGHVDHEYTRSPYYGDRYYDDGYGILLVLSGIGGRMRGIMRAVTLIITGSKRKEDVNE